VTVFVLTWRQDEPAFRTIFRLRFRQSDFSVFVCLKRREDMLFGIKGAIRRTKSRDFSVYFSRRRCFFATESGVERGIEPVAEVRLLMRCLVSKNIRHRASQSVHNVLKRINGNVLLHHFDPLQGGRRDADFQ
jgi:hypothetical protein